MRACDAAAAACYSYSPPPPSPPVSTSPTAGGRECEIACRVATLRDAAPHAGNAKAFPSRSFRSCVSLHESILARVIANVHVRRTDAGRLAAALNRRSSATSPVPRVTHADGRSLVAETRRTEETAGAPTAGLQLEAATVGSGSGGGGGAHDKDGDIVSRSSASDLTLVCFGRLPAGHGAGCRTHAARVCRPRPTVAGDGRADWLVRRCTEGCGEV